jgi:hypothetical protein
MRPDRWPHATPLLTSGAEGHIACAARRQQGPQGPHLRPNRTPTQTPPPSGKDQQATVTFQGGNSLRSVKAREAITTAPRQGDYQPTSRHTVGRDPRYPKAETRRRRNRSRHTALTEIEQPQGCPADYCLSPGAGRATTLSPNPPCPSLQNLSAPATRGLDFTV